MTSDCAPHSLYLIWRQEGGALALEARVQPDTDPPPGQLSLRGAPMPRDGETQVTRAMRGVPARVCDACARGYVALMRVTGERGVPPPMPREQAAAILGALASGASRRRMRAVVNDLGYGGGSRDLDLAVGVALRDGAPEGWTAR